jgi:hypothetical protein
VQQTDLLRKVIADLEVLEISYALVGSFASGAFGEPRLTHDIDIVVDLDIRQVDLLCAKFSEPEFYVSLAAAQQAVRHRGQFNVIHPTSGNKIDFMIARNDLWGSTLLERRLRIPLFPDQEGFVAAPEDIILGKMIYYREGASDKHLRDITGILQVAGSQVDRAYIERFAAKLGVVDIWQAILLRL